MRMELKRLFKIMNKFNVAIEQFVSSCFHYALDKQSSNIEAKQNPYMKTENAFLFPTFFVNCLLLFISSLFFFLLKMLSVHNSFSKEKAECCKMATEMKRSLGMAKIRGAEKVGVQFCEEMVLFAPTDLLKLFLSFSNFLFMIQNLFPTSH